VVLVVDLDGDGNVELVATVIRSAANCDLRGRVMMQSCPGADGV